MREAIGKVLHSQEILQDPERGDPAIHWRRVCGFLGLPSADPGHFWLSNRKGLRLALLCQSFKGVVVILREDLLHLADFCSLARCRPLVRSQPIDLEKRFYAVSSTCEQQQDQQGHEKTQKPVPPVAVDGRDGAAGPEAGFSTRLRSHARGCLNRL